MARSGEKPLHSPSPRQRADKVLLERGLFESRAQAQAAIAAGLVRIDGKTVARASDMVMPDAMIEAEKPHPFVSRGGVKLDEALKVYPLAIGGQTCLDVGASTGGFSQVLLAHGAAKVFAVDVGHGQLHASLAGRPDLVSMEGTDIRALAPGSLEPAPTIVVIDASFISLKAVLPAALGLAAKDCALLALIKPQFEVSRPELKKGILRDEAKHRAVCDDISALAASLGLGEIRVFDSAIAGGDGNREFFIGARRRATT